MNDKREQERERDEKREDRKMKPEWLHSAETVIDCKQRRDERAIRLIARQRTEGRRVVEEERDVPQLADGRIGFNRVRVVEMEAVVKMVRVGRDKGNQQERATETRESASAHHVRVGFRHRMSLS